MHLFLTVLVVFPMVGSSIASLYLDTLQSGARFKRISLQGSEGFRDNRRFFRRHDILARHRHSHTIDSGAHHVRAQLLDPRVVTPNFPLGVTKRKEVLGRLNLISDGRILGHIFHDSSASGGEVGIDMKKATAFKLVHFNFGDSLFHLIPREAGESTCLTLSWSVPKLTLENCYSLTQLEQAASNNKTQVFRIDRSSDYIIPVTYFSALLDGAEQSKITATEDSDTSEATAVITSGAISSTSTSRSEHRSTTSRSLSASDNEAGSAEVSISDSTPGTFSRITPQEFLDIYPWRFDRSAYE